VQCEQGEGCDFSNLFVQPADADGNYTTTFTVHRIITLGSEQVDCVAKQDCVLVSLDISDLSTGAQTSITFDPNAPFQKPLHLRVTAERTAHVTVDKGVVRLTGTVECNRAVTIEADMALTQVYGRSIFSSESFSEIDCDHGGHWSAVFRPQNGLFAPGSAKVRISAFGFAGGEQYQQLKSTPLTLVPRTS
jgi:hypothetical protein